MANAQKYYMPHIVLAGVFYFLPGVPKTLPLLLQLLAFRNLTPDSLQMEKEGRLWGEIGAGFKSQLSALFVTARTRASSLSFLIWKMEKREVMIVLTATFSYGCCKGWK